MSWMQRVARIVFVLGTAWILLYVTLGGTTAGKDFYGDHAKAIFPNAPKAAVPILYFLLPILIMGSVATFAVTLSTRRNLAGGGAAEAPSDGLLRPVATKNVSRSPRSADTPFDLLAICFLVVPCTIYFLGSCHRKLYGKNDSRNEQIMHVANIFAMMALVPLAVLLVPVTKHSSLLKLWHWNPAASVRLHIWSGRIVIVGVLAHGVMHMFRWVYNGESLFMMLFPPSACWDTSSEYKPKCNNKHTDCSCYHHFRNLTGFLAGAALVVIAFTTLEWVRRKHYTTFYLTHVLAAPTALCLMVLHYNKAIFYIAPSVLFYAGTVVPGMVEAWSSRAGTKVQSIKIIESSPSSSGLAHHRNCVAITFEATLAAVQKYRSGQYVKLRVPSVSKLISHPFTVNRGPSSPNELRVIFRATGKFTNQLVKELSATVEEERVQPPVIQVSGYFGTHLRLDQVLQHDVVAMVAGGIGITPYLSLLEDVVGVLGTQHEARRLTEQIYVHWICRDEELIRYVSEEYFEPLRQATSTNRDLRIRVIVHKTSGDMGNGETMRPYRDAKEDEDDMDDNRDNKDSRLEDGLQIQSTRRTFPTTAKDTSLPFQTPIFASGFGHSWFHNLPSMSAFCAIAWVGYGVIYALYVRNHAKSEITYRWTFVAAIEIVSLVAAIVLMLVMRFCKITPKDARIHQGILWSKVDDEQQQNDDDDGEAGQEVDTEEEDDETGLEMPELPNNGTPTIMEDEPLEEDEEDEDSEGGGDNGVVGHVVTLEQKDGRPTMQEMLKPLLDKKVADHPALFSCGPRSLMQSLKKEAEKNTCAARVRQRISCASPKIAVYEETFEM